MVSGRSHTKSWLVLGLSIREYLEPSQSNSSGSSLARAFGGSLTSDICCKLSQWGRACVHVCVALFMSARVLLFEFVSFLFYTYLYFLIWLSCRVVGGMCLVIYCSVCIWQFAWLSLLLLVNEYFCLYCYLFVCHLYVFCAVHFYPGLLLCINICQCLNHFLCCSVLL